MLEVEMLKEMSEGSPVKTTHDEMELGNEQSQGFFEKDMEEEDENGDEDVKEMEKNSRVSSLSVRRRGGSIIGMSDPFELCSAAYSKLTRAVQIIAQAKNEIRESLMKYFKLNQSNKLKLTEDMFKLVSNGFEFIVSGINLVDKARVFTAESNRDIDQLSHQNNTLKLEIKKLTEYEAQIQEENYELVRRLGLFEEEMDLTHGLISKLEKAKDNIEEKYDDEHLRLIEKLKELEVLKREKSDMQVKIGSLEKNLSLLESLAESQKEDLMKDREVVEGFNATSKQLTHYKVEFSKKQIEFEMIQLQLNSVNMNLKNCVIDLSNEQELNGSLRKEIRDLKERLNELETQKRGYIKDMGLSKLGISTLNFSKMFHHEAANNPSSNRESMVNVVRKNDLDSSNILKTRQERLDKLAVSEINLTATEKPPKASFFAPQSNINKSTVFREPSLFRTQEKGQRIKESRISSMLFALGGSDPNENFDSCRDYMSLYSSPKISTELMRLGVKIEQQSCYSDTIFLFNKSFRKTRVIVLVAETTLSFFNLRKTKLLKLYQLKSLKGITISSSNYTLSVFHFQTQADLLVESYRRLELISYINHMFKNADLPRFELTVRKRFIVKTETSKQPPERIEVTDPNLKINVSFLQEAIRGSKSGYLNRLSKNWFGGSSSTDCFCLLSNIGIVCFKKYGVNCV